MTGAPKGPRIQRECQHTKTTHVHGTHVAYVIDRCRCQPCTDATAAYERNRTKQKAYGRWTPYVDAEPARQHLRALMDAGIGLKRVKQLAQVSTAQLGQIMYGIPSTGRPPTRRIRRETERRILAVQPHTAVPAGGQATPITGTLRRIQALVAAGYSISSIARRMGMGPANFHTLMSREQVTVATAAKMAAVYRELALTSPAEDEWHQKASVSRARRYARARGWPGPGAWFEIDMDDPAAEADLSAIRVERRGGGRGIKRDDQALIEDAELLASTGETLEMAARRFGLAPRSLDKELRRAGRDDLVRALNTPASERVVQRGAVA